MSADPTLNDAGFCTECGEPLPPDCYDAKTCTEYAEHYGIGTALPPGQLRYIHDMPGECKRAAARIEQTTDEHIRTLGALARKGRGC